MRQTFIEKFSKTYAYPYGNAFISNKDSGPITENLAQEHAERILLGKRTMRPFHLECPSSKKRVCYCTGDEKSDLLASQALAYDMHLYYEGYDADLQITMLRKLQLEQERLQHITRKSYADTFDKFIESLDAEEVQEQLTSIQQNPGSLLIQKDCSYCKGTIFDSQGAQSWKNEKGQSVVLCGKCNQQYISGMIEPTSSENKKVTRYMQNAVGVGSAVASIPTQNAQNGAAASLKAKPKRPKRKDEQKDSEGQDINKCQECHRIPAPASDTNDTLQCAQCGQVVHGECHKPPLSSSLCKRFDWECANCKACRECMKTSDESKILICEMCDQSVHIHCLEPPLAAVPTQSWFCKSCVECRFCSKELPPISKLSQGHWLDSSRERLCPECHKQYHAEGSKKEENDEDLCGKCKKAYQGEFVECEGQCKQWHCVPCSKLTSLQIQNISDVHYVCVNCSRPLKI